MLTVVIGAGASHDAVAHESWNPPNPLRPPLGDQLFDTRFERWLTRWERAIPIATYLRQRRKGKSVEQILDGLAIDAADSPVRRKQLAAVRFYLHTVIREIDNRWEFRPTNFETLLDEIIHTTSQEVVLVTFNYDQLLERALRTVDVHIGSMSDYVADPRFRLFKVHGSSDWGREVGVTIEDLESRSVWDIATELVERVDEWRLGEFHMTGDEWPIVRTIIPSPSGRAVYRALVPAVSVPLTTKPQFELPPDHFALLGKMLKETTHLLTIGWKAGDRPFLELLGESIKHEISILAVANTNPDGVLNQLKSVAGLRGQTIGQSGGFTQFIVQKRMGAWFRGELDPVR